MLAGRQGGFCPEKSKFEGLTKLVAYLAIPRWRDFMDELLARCQCRSRPSCVSAGTAEGHSSHGPDGPVVTVVQALCRAGACDGVK